MFEKKSHQSFESNPEITTNHVEEVRDKKIRNTLKFS
jgi:hypothetical protein